MPYVDKLIADSKLAPTIFIYSGEELSVKQKRMFEGLHNRAEESGGKIFVLDLGISLPDWQSDRRLQYIKKNLQSDKDFFIDRHRLIILNEIKKIISILKDKYECQRELLMNSKYCLYADFDFDPMKHLEDIKTKQTPDIDFALPIKTSWNNDVCSIIFEINSICVPVDGSKFLRDADNIPNNEIVKYFDYKACTNPEEAKKYDKANGIYTTTPITLFAMQFARNVAIKFNKPLESFIKVEDCEINVTIKNVTIKAKQERALLEKIITQYGLQYSGGCKDFTWRQDISAIILEDCKTHQENYPCVKLIPAGGKDDSFNPAKSMPGIKNMFAPKSSIKSTTMSCEQTSKIQDRGNA